MEAKDTNKYMLELSAEEVRSIGEKRYMKPLFKICIILAMVGLVPILIGGLLFDLNKWVQAPLLLVGVLFIIPSFYITGVKAVRAGIAFYSQVKEGKIK